MAHQHLDSRLTPNINFTRHDEITFSLMDAIKCPISMDISDNMIIFNHQYYDRHSFDCHERAKTILNQRCVRERLIEQDEIRLKDPRTGQDFNPTYAIRSLYHARPTRQILASFIMKRIP